jgi:hypothetical protein
VKLQKFPYLVIVISSLLLTGCSSLGFEKSTLKACELQVELIEFAKSDYDSDEFSEHVRETYELALRISEVAEEGDVEFFRQQAVLFSEMADPNLSLDWMPRQELTDALYKEIPRICEGLGIPLNMNP